VPRFHVTWGTGPGIIEPFVNRTRAAEAKGLVKFAFRHRVDELIVEGGAVVGVRGQTLEPSAIERGQDSSRVETGAFEARAQAVLVSSGGIGGNFDLVRENWPERMRPAPQKLISGVPKHVDGRMLGISESAGADLIGRDRMWHYVEGLHNWDPIWTNHGIRIIPGPSSLWLDATGKRLPAPNFPGFDTLGTLEHICGTGHDHTWFVLTQKIIAKEFALSGSEQNPDITERSVKQMLQTRLSKSPPGPVQKFMDNGEDFIVDNDLDRLLTRMLDLGEGALDVDEARRQIIARDREVVNDYSKDLQIAAIHEARRYKPDRVTRVAKPHKLLDPNAGPLVAVKLHILTRKTLGGLHTDLDARVLAPDGDPLPGLYAAGEVAGFGGGGMHGYRALEGTFLGGCLFSGRCAGRAMAAAV
jgi:hypothetical protein